MAATAGTARRVVVAVVALQIAVPAAVLVLAEPPARFGWQMFGTVSAEVSASVEDAAGTRELDLRPYVARLRPEVDYLEWLPSHLCAQLDVIRVEVRRGDDVVERTCAS